MDHDSGVAQAHEFHKRLSQAQNRVVVVQRCVGA
jgi:hypothetical protein